MRTRFFFGSALLLIILTLTAGAVFAGSAAFSGTFAGDPTMAVVTISTTNCISQGASQVRYDAFPFTVSATGAYSFSAASTGGSGTLASIYIMNSGFNPAAALGNCIAASNNGNAAGSIPTTLNNVNLTAGTQYYLVIFDDTFAQTTPGYNFSANGVGDIILGGAPGSCIDPLPAGTPIRNVPLGAPAYYEPDLGTLLSFSLPAGNWYVTDTSGDFAQVWIDCNANRIWIPLTALGG
ncbi:MAG: hypothetical protein IPO91_10540 [Chloroflexi bacterium]|nr:hypothetical protein [Chloroflexota bacterium]